MRRKSIFGLKYIILAMLMSLGMTGCGNRIPEMTAEQAKQIGEYAAITLLKYDANHRSRLVDEETIAEYDRKQQSLKELMEQQNTKPSTEGMKPTENTPTVDAGEQTTNQQQIKSLEESLAVPEGIGVSFQGYKICDSYPDDGSADKYFTLDATTGKKIMVLEFAVANQTSANVGVDFFSKTATFSASVGDGKRYSAMTTMLLDDLSTYAGTITAGESRKLVLLFEVEESIAEKITDVQLYLKNDSQTYTIQL